MADPGGQFHDTDIYSALEALERRVARLEESAGSGSEAKTPLTSQSTSNDTTLPAAAAPHTDQSGMELRFGEFGLPWIGSIIFILGIIFLMAYVSSLGHTILFG